MDFSLTAPVPDAPQLDQPTVLLIDADFWTYQLAAVLQSRDPKPQANTTPVELSDGTMVHVEPLQALYTLIDATLRDLKYTFNTSNVEIYLQGKRNFREDLAVTKPYKGNRSNVKPYYYEECREYLKRHHGAIVIDGHETDDQVSIRQCHLMSVDMPSVIVSPDKDLKNTHGLNYNPRTHVLTNISDKQAERHFWEQMVIGDNSVDNIPGVHRVGAAWVNKLSGLSNRVFKQRVMNLYMEKHDRKYMIEQGNLLHMCRSYDEIGKWTPEYDYLKGYVPPAHIEYHPIERDE